MSEIKPTRHELRGEYYYDNMVLFDSHVPRILEEVKTMDFDGDVIIAGYPKTGTTWVEEVAWIINNNGDVNTASTTPLFERVPFTEMYAKGLWAVLDKIKEMPHPRMLKSHLPARYFRKHLDTGDTKFIIVIRNPKDELVSYFHFYRMNAELNHFKGTWSEFFELFKENHLLYGNYFDWYREWLSELSTGKVLLVKYEDLKKDTMTEIQRIAHFFNKQLSEDTMKEIEKHCTFSEMADNKMVNYSLFPDHMKLDISPFMRKGVVGDWKNYFSNEQSELVDKMYKAWVKDGGVELEFE